MTVLQPCSLGSGTWNTSLKGPDEALDSDLITPSVSSNRAAGSKPETIPTSRERAREREKERERERVRES